TAVSRSRRALDGRSRCFTLESTSRLTRPTPSVRVRSLANHEEAQMAGRALRLRTTLVATALAVVVVLGGIGIGQAPRVAVDIGGVVTGARGPEAGVWVIAETTELPTRLIKSVVTDEQGRFLIPDLPKANYDIWVRGYGLIDSPKTKSAPGNVLALSAVAAPN